MKFDLNRPWLTLDKWQEDYINTPPEQDCFLLCGRQSGKTTAMSIKAVELCVKHFKKGEFVLINSITEKQAYHMLTKALVYAKEKYNDKVKWKGKDKPTMHKIIFNNGTGILCFAAGETGEGQRGFTIKKLMVDEGARMSEEYYIAAMPMLSVIRGSMDIGSTPAGKRHKDGTEKFFYKCSLDPNFKQFYASSEDCPRHTKEFLEGQKERMSKLFYAQEYLAMFLDELMRLFDDDLIKKACSIKKMDIHVLPFGKKYLGVDVAGFGKDLCAYESVQRESKEKFTQIHHLIEKRNFTIDTTNRIIALNNNYGYTRIGVDDGGLGFGVFSELMNTDSTKRKTEALNNASRPLNNDGTKSKKILKNEMYLNLLSCMESGKLSLFDDDEIKASLASIQYEDEEIFGYNSHITEALMRAVWLAVKDKSLNIFAHTF